MSLGHLAEALREVRVQPMELAGRVGVRNPHLPGHLEVAVRTSQPLPGVRADFAGLEHRNHVILRGKRLLGLV